MLDNEHQTNSWAVYWPRNLNEFGKLQLLKSVLGRSDVVIDGCATWNGTIQPFWDNNAVKRFYTRATWVNVSSQRGYSTKNLVILVKPDPSG